VFRIFLFRLYYTRINSVVLDYDSSIVAHCHNAVQKTKHVSFVVLCCAVMSVTVGECASSSGVGTPRVSLYCPPQHMIHVQRSFHGARTTTSDRCSGGGGGTRSNCTYCPGDCIDETAGVVYDWTECTGREECSRTVLQSLMAHCSRGVTEATPVDSETNDVAAHSVTWEHFSDYVNVDYECINRTNFTSSVTLAIEPHTDSFSKNCSN